MSDVEAGYIGLIKFSGQGIEIFKQSFLKAKEASLKGEKSWGASRPFKNAYMTDMLQGLVNEGNDLRAVEINRGWLEIDSNDDYLLKIINLYKKSCIKDGNFGIFYKYNINTNL